MRKNGVISKVPATKLEGDARNHYEEIMEVLVKDKVIKKIDIPIIESACEVYAQYQSMLESEDPSKSLPFLKAYLSIMEKYGATEKARHSMQMEREATKRDSDGNDLLKEFKVRNGGI